MIPIAGLTRSGIQFFTWTQRFIRRLALEGFKEGWAFRRLDGLQAKALDYQDNLFRKLEIIQATTEDPQFPGGRQTALELAFALANTT